MTRRNQSRETFQVFSGAPNVLAHAIRYALVRWYGAT